jgi:uncharacterized protein (DUF58 family)
MHEQHSSLSIDPRLLQRLKGIELRSRFLVRGLYNNRHRTTDFGASNEFIEHRDYQPGDDIGAIDWRVYARTDRHYVKRFEMESNMKVLFLLDTTDSMRVPAARGLPTKLELASVIVAAVAMMAVSQQDAAGLYCIGEKIEERIPPRQGQRHLSLIHQHLSAPKGNRGTNFGAVARQAMREMGQRGMVFVVTDALDEPEPLFEMLRGFMVRLQDVTLFQILDRKELAFPFDTMTDFRHPESGEHIMGDPLRLRTRYLERMQAHLDRIAAFCGKTGVDYLRLANDDDLVKLLSSHFLRRLIFRRSTC